MWLYIGFCIALFYVVKIQSNSPDNEPEEMFVDVIKNISRVNNVLQELISNYETLQKIYKSQENIDSSKYSDSDTGEVFENKKKKPKSQTSKATKKEKFAATEMYWSDHEEETKNDFKQSKEDHTEKANVVKKDKNIVRQEPRTSTTTIRPKELSSSESSDSEENVESVLKEKIEMSPQIARENNNKAISKSSKAISKSIKAQKESEDRYAISSYNKYLQPFIDAKAAKTRSRKIYKSKYKSANTGLNIPYLNVSDRVKVEHISQNPNKVKNNYSPKADDSNNIRTHKKKIFSENLPTKTSIFDLFKDTPIELEAHSDIFMENVEKPITNREKKFRNEIVTHKNKRRDIDKLRSTNSKHFHKKEDLDKVVANATHLTLPEAENVRVTKGNDSHHKTKKNIKKIDDDTQIINNDHKKGGFDHKANNKHHKTVNNEKVARGTDNDNKKTQDDDKRDDIGYKEAPNENKKLNKRHKKDDIETESKNKDHKTVKNNEEQRGTEAKNKEKKKLYNETQVNHETQSSDESVFMDKNETKVLREAYGEACMKVVVRKCYKACTKSSKLVCSQTTCKSSLKSAFKQNSKTACITRFTAATNETSDLNSEEGLFTHKRRALQEKFSNLNAGGFHVCLPTLGVQTEPTLKPSTNETDSTRRKMNEKVTEEKVSFNILRDRFERACKKLSYKKCHDACKCSWDNACSTYDCSKRLKGLYKKHCKATCKTAYGLNKKRSDSDSDSDSDVSSS